MQTLCQCLFGLTVHFIGARFYDDVFNILSNLQLNFETYSQSSIARSMKGFPTRFCLNKLVKPCFYPWCYLSIFLYVSQQKTINPGKHHIAYKYFEQQTKRNKTNNITRSKVSEIVPIRNCYHIFDSRKECRQCKSVHRVLIATPPHARGERLRLCACDTHSDGRAPVCVQNRAAPSSAKWSAPVSSVKVDKPIIIYNSTSLLISSPIQLSSQQAI